MKFSILIANYNNGKFFKNCFDSIIAQEYGNWEGIILDDASIDDSLEIIRNIIQNDSRFKIFTNGKNSGVGVTKSKLIELATGEICGFADPDDALTPTALSKAIDIFKKERKTVLTYSKFAKCDENLKIIEVPKLAMQVINGDPFFFNYPVHIVHFVAFRRAVYLKTEKIDTDLKIAEDQDLYLKMYEQGAVKFIDETHYLYRTHGGGISQNDNLPKAREYFSKVIFSALKRRNIKEIHGKKVPEHYRNSKEIYDLLDFQNAISYRIYKKLKIFWQQTFSK